MKTKLFTILFVFYIPALILSKILEFELEKLNGKRISFKANSENHFKYNLISFFEKSDNFRFLADLEKDYHNNSIIQFNNSNTNSTFPKENNPLNTKSEDLEILANIPSTKLLDEFIEGLSDEFNYTSKTLVVKAQIGNPKQELILEIDTTISTTWVPSVDCKSYNATKKYNASISRTVQVTNETLKIEDHMGDLEGKVVYDDFRINDLGIEIRNFPFIQANQFNNYSVNLPEGKLALSNINKYGEKFSFLNSLKNKGKISKKLFALEFQNEASKGRIYFGDIPEKYKTWQKEGKYGMCNVTTSEGLDEGLNNGWICELTHIFFNQKNRLRNISDSIEFDNSKVIFDSTYEFIGVTNNQYDLIYQNYIKENFKGMCKKITNNNDIYFICNLDKKTLESAESMFLIIQGFVLEFTAKDLFLALDAKHNYLFAIKFFKAEDEIVNLWILGHQFLNKFFTVFDAEANQMHFYNEDIYDISSEWNQWFNSDYYSILLTRYFYLSVAACAAVAVFLLFMCFIILRSLKRRSLEHGPLVENEMK